METKFNVPRDLIGIQEHNYLLTKLREQMDKKWPIYKVRNKRGREWSNIWFPNTRKNKGISTGTRQTTAAYAAILSVVNT